MVLPQMKQMTMPKIFKTIWNISTEMTSSNGSSSRIKDTLDPLLLLDKKKETLIQNMKQVFSTQCEGEIKKSSENLIYNNNNNNNNNNTNPYNNNNTKNNNNNNPNNNPNNNNNNNNNNKRKREMSLKKTKQNKGRKRDGRTLVTVDSIVMQKLTFRQWEKKQEAKIGEEKFLQVWEKMVSYRNEKPERHPATIKIIPQKREKAVIYQLAKEGYTLWWNVRQLKKKYPTMYQKAVKILRNT